MASEEREGDCGGQQESRKGVFAFREAVTKSKENLVKKYPVDTKTSVSPIEDQKSLPSRNLKNLKALKKVVETDLT